MPRAEQSRARRTVLYAIVAVLGLGAAAAGGALLAAPEPPVEGCARTVLFAQAPAGGVAAAAQPAVLKDEPLGPTPVPDIETGVCSLAASRLVWPGRPYCQ